MKLEEIKQMLSKKSCRLNGKPALQCESTASNFLKIFQHDPHFADVKFNDLKKRLEIIDEEGNAREWTSADDASSRTYIEENYGISNERKWADALNEFAQMRKYNPIQDKLEKLAWDGKPRCETFLIDWLKADDTPYNREVSRLIFAGGISRALDPGCKFEIVPILMGAQGTGKSTFCQWLSMDKTLYNSVKTINGQKGAEEVQGIWICELEEMLAVLSSKSGSKAEENAKAFISRSDDFYRAPYTKRSEHNFRSCIFIGTTNKQKILSDKTGNRRWFPVLCKAQSNELFAHEEECKAAIIQAWAEMKEAYDKKEAKASLIASDAVNAEIKKAQEDAMEDDWRLGFIEDFIKDRPKVCLRQIHEEAYSSLENKPKAYSKAEANDLADILVNHFKWIPGNSENFGEIYHKQKAYYNPKFVEASADDETKTVAA